MYHQSVELFALLGAAALVLAGVDRLLRYCEARGWIYYRKGRGSWGGLGSAMMEIHNIYDPARRHVLEVQHESEWKRDEDDDGDDHGARGDQRP
jgi:hypothetical protein